MKVGIVTFHSAHNYGAMLQTYALQEEVRGLGHSPIVVNFHPDYVEQHNRRIVSLRSARGLLIHCLSALVRRKLAFRYERFELFRRQYFEETQRYPNEGLLMSNPPGCDAYICGSDQIWNLDSPPSEAYFLRFAEKEALRIAYAPSFGTASIPSKHDVLLTSWLSDFDHLSAREISGATKLATLTQKPVPHVVDPVFFRSPKTWERLAVAPKFSGEYIAAYSLESTNSFSQIASRVAKQLNLPLVILGKAGVYMLWRKSVLAIDSGPREFVGWIKHSRFIVTNSFHATSFALMFRVPFLTVAHSSRNSRLQCLLETAGLGEHIVRTPADMLDGSFVTDRILHHKPHVCPQLQDLISASQSFLSRSLGSSLC
jgi:hypothetical protein